MQATAYVWRMEKKLVFLVLSFILVPLTKSRLSGLVASAFTTDLTEPGADSFPQLLPSLLTGFYPLIGPMLLPIDVISCCH